LDDSDFRSFIERVKLAAPIEEVVGARVRGLKRSGSTYKACCPFHEEDTPSFVVTPDRGLWHCFGACSEGGDAISFIQRDAGLSFRESVEELARAYGVDLPRGWGKGDGNDPRKEAAFDVLARAERFFQRKLMGEPGQRARAYLAGRGLEQGTIEAFGLGWAPRGNQLLKSAEGGGASRATLVDSGLVREGDRGAYDFFRERLIVPIRDAFGRSVGFGARLLPGGEGPKYVNTAETPLFQKGRLVYGLDLARAAIRRERHVILVEGYTDVMAAHQVGVRTVAAVLGTSTTDQHAGQQKRFEVMRQADSHHRERTDDQQPGVGAPWSDPVAEPADEEPGDDGHGDRGDDGVADLGLGQLKVVADDGHQWGDSEPSEEGEEECEPGDVERAHLDAADVEEIDLRGAISNPRRVHGSLLPSLVAR